jgi:hypothetical protein
MGLGVAQFTSSVDLAWITLALMATAEWASSAANYSPFFLATYERVRTCVTIKLVRTNMSDENSYNSIPISKSIDERPTEDDLAQASLGGPRGSTTLAPAPLTKQEKEQNSPNDDPGHVA